MNSEKTIEIWKKDFKASVYYVFLQFYREETYYGGFTVPMSVN